MLRMKSEGRQRRAQINDEEVEIDDGEADIDDEQNRRRVKHRRLDRRRVRTESERMVLESKDWNETG